jgi:[amino group carrier protein]-lysine/ornithine hydrolase
MDEVGILRALVEAYSPSGQEANAVQVFLGLAEGLGLDATSDGAGNAIARIGTGPPTVLFLGHIDTVEGELPVRIDDGRITGRGTCDAKGPLASALVAASRYEGPGELQVIGAVGEERDSSGARYLITRHRPDFLIVGEPSGWDAVTIGYRGTLSLVLAVDGNRTHLSAPEETTVERALSITKELAEFCREHGGKSPFASPTMKLHTIQTSRSGDREHVEIGVNVRVPPGLRTDEVLAFLGPHLKGAQQQIMDRSEAVEVDPRNEVVRALCTGIRDEGARPRLLRKLGTSDLNLAAPAWQCPAAAYGPGDSHLDHTDQESLDLRDFQRSVEILRTAFVRLTRGSPTTIPSKRNDV